ncbi:hypothetical protein QR77_29075, partial [Streptomyces sp. 150FB]|uniref:AMP-binding protein n=1 Tax=Streptomyces sp. 150FB TaxID=1576605 RepID=UPI0005896817
MESESALRYWRERLTGFAQPTRLGIERTAAGRDRARARLPWTPGRTALLDRAAGAAGIGTEHLVLGAWALVLAAHAGERDVLFGAAMDATDTEPLPLRVGGPGSARRVGAYLREIRDQVESGRRHDFLTARQFAACADLPDDTALFDIAARCRRTATEPASDPAAATAPAPGPAPSAVPAAPPYAIELHVALGPEPGLVVDHAVDRIGTVDAQRLLTHLDRMVTALAEAAPGDPLDGLGMLFSGEFDRIVHEWNDTATDRGELRCLHELFELQAARTPDALAVVQGEERLSYAELDAAADRLAARLAAAGAGGGDLVALSLRRTVHIVVALLGVLKSGAAYAPVDPALPAERVRGLIEALAAPVVLTDPETVPAVLAHCAGLPALREVLWLGGDGGDGGGPVTEPGAHPA